MKLFKMLFASTLLTSLTLFHPSNILAQTDYESFRQDLITFVETYGNADSELMLDILDMSSEELAEYYSMFSDPTVFAQVNDQAEARQAFQQEANSQLTFEQLLLAPASGFSPNYPSGGNYDVYTAALPGLGIMLAGPTNRTDASAVGGAWLASDTSENAARVAQAVCDAASFPVNIVACAAAGVATGLALADQIVLQQAAYQDALIDGAETEAAYENSVVTIGQGNALSADLGTHDSEIKALIENGTAGENQQLIKIIMSRQVEIMRLLITPNSKRAVNEDVLTCTGDDCPEYPATQLCPNGSLRWNCKL